MQSILLKHFWTKLATSRKKTFRRKQNYFNTLLSLKFIDKTHAELTGYKQ